MTTDANHLTTPPATARDTPRGPVVDHGVIHDLLNPLTSVVGNIDLLDEILRGQAAPQVLKSLGAALASAEELRDMIENLRYLMFEGTPAAPAMTRMDLAVMFKRLEEQARSRALDKPPTEFHIHATRPLMVKANDKLLRRAMDVLLRTVTRLGTRSTADITQSGDAAVDVRFAHHGRAIPDDLTGCLFDPGFAQIQYDRAVKIDRARGLWFVRRVAEAHRGAVHYEPRTDGGDFVVRLPLE